MREAVAVVSRVAVDVSAPVAVAALVNGSDPVEVFDRARWRWLWAISCAGPSAPGFDHAHDIVPAHERGHDHGSGTGAATSTST